MIEISGNRSRIVHGERFCENRKFRMEFSATGSTYLLRQCRTRERSEKAGE
jgi:hypothetical protein